MEQVIHNLATKAVLHKAQSRGKADYGWLKTNYSFSFAQYFNPENIHFGALRVLNDDVVAPGGGFDTHPHDNMEIITIPLFGTLRHKDSMGHIEDIVPNEVQVMSAGTGVFTASIIQVHQRVLGYFRFGLFLKNAM
ncbi:MAG: pirin family protein [Breznakibacter sp.]